MALKNLSSDERGEDGEDEEEAVVSSAPSAALPFDASMLVVESFFLPRREPKLCAVLSETYMVTERESG